MSTINTLHTINQGANIPLGYLDEDNIRFIQQKVLDVLKREFTNDIRVDRASIIRIMDRVLREKLETIPKMNQRVIMTICNEIRNHQLERDIRMRQEEFFELSQRLFDPVGMTSHFDPQTYKPPNRLGNRKVGSTTRFYFT